MNSYEECLMQLKASSKAAYDYIPKMCNALRQENPQHSNNDIRDRVTKDCLEVGLARATIIHNIPQEFKDPDKVEAGKKGAERKKIVLSKTTSGAAAAEAENSPESPNESNLSSLAISAKDIKGDSGIDESHKLKEEDEDAESMKKALIKLIEENQQKDFLIEQLEKQKSQLSDVIKKDSFIIATDYKPELPKKFEFPEPDENNTFVWRNISFDEFRMKLGPLKARSNSKINVYLERVT
jgi:hypothetical protein